MEKIKKVGKPRGRSGGRHVLGDSITGRRGRSLYCTSYEHDLLQAFLDVMRISDDLAKITEGEDAAKEQLWKDFIQYYKTVTNIKLDVDDMNSPGNLSMYDVYAMCSYGQLSISKVYRAWKKDRVASLPRG